MEVAVVVMVEAVVVVADAITCSLANARITWFIVFGRSFGARGTIALTVSSRSTADVSTKPSEMCCAEGGGGG